MNQQSSLRAPSALPRRDFLKTAALAGLASAALPLAGRSVFAAGSDVLRIGLVGCGRRGTGAANDCLNSSPNVELVAMGDLFRDKLDGAFGSLKGRADKFKVTPERCFVGFDACQKVLASGVDLVILAMPPGFRPEYLRLAVEAGKHVFMEKPVAVDPLGVRSILASAELAKAKKLALVAGTQRRHQPSYLETIKRIHDGQIGRLISAEAYWLGDYGYYPAVKRQNGWSDMEWQIRNWNYFAWLSGDHIVEQHVHNLDVIRWALQGDPVRCIATGSRSVRTAPEFGHIYDNFSVSYEFPNGVHVLSMCRQMSGTSNRVTERIHGSKGTASDGSIVGDTPFKYEGATPNPYVQEHADLIASIRAGAPLNEGAEIARSTLMAIMGRMSAYTGREIGWDWVLNASKLDLRPPKYEFGELPVPPVAVPGQTALV